jgi:hypothetical protein
MKKILPSILSGAAIFAVALCAANLPAETNTVPVRIGIYDGRVVAFAWFWSGAHQQELKQQIQNARAAKAAGDTQHFQELSAKLKEMQDEGHREVFSTAPPVEALAELANRLPEIQKDAGVTALASKWDEAALKNYPGAERVDVTDRLAQEFKPTGKVLKIISSIKESQPIPLDECNELIRKDKI